MVTVQEVADKSGLSTKTLSRWVMRGALPKPVIQTHSSGRGKQGVWPDHVLERCLKLAALRKEGHTLDSALASFELSVSPEPLPSTDEWTLQDVINGRRVDLPEGIKISALQFLVSQIGGELQRSVVDRDWRRQILGDVRHHDLLRVTLNLVQDGFYPVLTFDGRDTKVVPDFLAGQLCDSTVSVARSLFLLPLWPAVQRFLLFLGLKDPPRKPYMTVAPKVWAQEGSETVEYLYLREGSQGFRVLRPTAAIVATNVSSYFQDREDAPPSS